MIDPVQVILLLVISLLTILLLVLGVQVFFILKELRRTIRRTNRILENTETITESVSEPISFLSEIVLNTGILSVISKVLRKTRDGED